MYEIIVWNKLKEIVKILMEQEDNNAIGSGIGNYLVAEILYDAKISPHKTLVEIYKNDKLIKSLTKSIKYITKLSYTTSINEYSGQYKEFYDYIKEGKYDKFHDDIKLKKNDNFFFKIRWKFLLYNTIFTICAEEYIIFNLMLLIIFCINN
jgi:formamidopyrimidine-DNA glycosylase